ncbi:MAG: hypothetical protein ACTSRF_12110 [Candidatus Freyarchaeota archaeon]
MRDERTGATAERAYVFARGETGEGDRVTGVGRADGAEFPAWVEGDGGWFEEIYVRAERSSVVENWETDRPVDASLIMFPPGADVREELRVTRDPALRDLRAFGWSREFWTDSEGYPTIRNTKWLILQREEGGERQPSYGDRARVVIIVRTDVTQLRPERDGIINRNSYTTFFPLGSGEELETKGSTGHRAGKRGGEEKGGQRWIRLLFGDRDENTPRNDYRFQGGLTELVYWPPEDKASDEAGAQGTSGTVGLVEGVVCSERSLEHAAEETEENSTGENFEDASAVGETSKSAVERDDEPSGLADADEASVEVDESLGKISADDDGKVSKSSGISGTSEFWKDAPKSALGDVEVDETSSAGESEKDTPVEENEEDSFVELEGAGRVSVKDVLKLVGEGIFRWGEEEYYRRLRERGVELDWEKLSRMLFVERRVPVRIYRVLKSLQGDALSGGKLEAWDLFIVVEGWSGRRVLPILSVLHIFLEGVKRCGWDEDRYCEELRRCGAPEWLYAWLLRRMVYERRIPEEVLYAALSFLGKGLEREQSSRIKTQLSQYIKPCSGAFSEDSGENNACKELNAEIEFIVLPNGEIVSLSGEEDFTEIVGVINELLDFRWKIESAESENYIITLLNGKRYTIGPVSCFLVLDDGRRIAVMLPEPAIVVQGSFPNLRAKLKKVVENILASEEEPLKYLRFLTTEDDLLEILDWWVSWYLRGLSEVTSEDVKVAIQKFEERLEKVVRKLFEEGLNLSREKVEAIRETAKSKYFGGYMKTLAKKIEMKVATLKSSLKRKRIKRGALIKIYDTLNLAYPQDLYVDKKEFLVALLTAKGEGRRRKPNSPWWEQPSGVRCILNKDELEKAYSEAINRYKTKIGIVREIKKAGLEDIDISWVRRFLDYRYYEVEKTRKLLEIIGWKPERVKELCLGELKDDDPLDVPKEGKGGKHEIINCIKRKRKEENSREKIAEYAARKLSEKLQKSNSKRRVNPSLVHSWLYVANKRIPKNMYLLMCSLFDVELNKSLYSRKSLCYSNFERKRTSKVNFRKPVKFKLKNGETIEIIEEEGEFYVVRKNRKLLAEKYISRVGEEGWGLTIIDYETVDGVYTVVKELGELWQPDTQPWYITFKNLRLQVNSKLLKNLAEILQDALKTKEELKNNKREKSKDRTKLREISEIVGINIDILEDSVFES